MSFFAAQTQQLLHKIHRWGGLFLAFFILFYCLTGILLNHRQTFDYFTDKEIHTQQISAADLTALTSFIDHYKKQINRPDNPTVIRIRDNSIIEFLYGSHGKTTYSIDAERGTMEVSTKHPRQPFAWLNQLHKTMGTGPFWLILTDLFSFFAVLTTLSVMIVMKYRPIDFAMMAAGIVLSLAGVLLA